MTSRSSSGTVPAIPPRSLKLKPKTMTKTQPLQPAPAAPVNSTAAPLVAPPTRMEAVPPAVPPAAHESSVEAPPTLPASSIEAPQPAAPTSNLEAPPVAPSSGTGVAPAAAPPSSINVRRRAPNPTLCNLPKPDAYNLVVELDGATSDASLNSPTSDCSECGCLPSAELFDGVKEGFQELGRRLEWLERELAVAVREQREMEVRFREVVQLVERVVNGWDGGEEEGEGEECP